MAHVGKKWPNQFQRDFWIEAGPQWAIHNQWRWRGNGSLAGTLGGGWGQHCVSEPGVANLATGEVWWEWLPPPTANPLVRYWLRMFIQNTPAPQSNHFQCFVSYNGVKGPPFGAEIDLYTQNHYINFAGGCFIIVPGVGTVSSLVTQLEGMRWIDF